MTVLTIFQGTGAIRWIPIGSPPSNLAALSVATNLTGSIDLLGIKGSESITPDISGFDITDNDIPGPDLISPEIVTIPGTTTFGDGTLTWYKTKTNTAIYTMFATRGTRGYIVRAPQGILVGDPYEIHTVTVKRRRLLINVDNTPQKFAVMFSVQAWTQGIIVA